MNKDSHYELATAYFFAGRLDKAIATYRADLRLFPPAEGDHEMMGEVLLKKGDAKAALAEIQQEPGESWRLVDCRWPITRSASMRSPMPRSEN